MDKKNVIVVDYDTNNNWEYLSGMNSGNLRWSVENFPSNSLSQKKRWKCYFSTGFSLFKKRKKYKRMVFVQLFYGLCMAFFLSLFNIKNGPEIYLTEFIYIKKNGLKGKLFYWLFKKALSYKNMILAICLSSNEIKYYSSLFPRAVGKFQFLKIGTHKGVFWNSIKGDYFLSAGASNRDYAFLIDCFAKLPNKKLIIVCDSLYSKTTKNVTIVHNCNGKDYEHFLANCFAVILSLNDANPVSSGQLVANRAFAYNKPVIIVDHPGIRDYVVDGENGLVIHKDYNELNSAIKKLTNCFVYDKISNSKMHNYFEFDYSKQIENLVERFSLKSQNE